MAKQLQRPNRMSMQRMVASGAFLGGIAFTAYVVWIGVSGQEVPLWFILLATVL